MSGVRQPGGDGCLPRGPTFAGAGDAFTVSDDHAMQERVFANLSEWNDDLHGIRDALTEHEIAATDRCVRFITLAAYEQAGGGARCDLSCEDDSGTLFSILISSTASRARSSMQSPRPCG